MCEHNARIRYTDGFHCEDCDTFFSVDSPTYRSDELLCSIWMVLRNINADQICNNLPIIQEVKDMEEEIGIGIEHANYEELITKAEKIMAKYGKNSKSATITLEE